MEGIEEKIRELEKWLTLEKQEDLRQFQSYLLPLSLAEKRERGYLWYPLTILHQGFSIGENIKVSVERTKNNLHSILSYKMYHANQISPLLLICNFT